MKRFFNFDYFNLWKELALLSRLHLTIKDRSNAGNNRILIIDPCLIGEFAASVPAIYDFIRRHTEKRVDLLVTPSLQELAKRITGVGDVFTTSAAYGRERTIQEEEHLRGVYEKIIVLRISPKAFKGLKKLSGHEVQTAFPYIFKYAFSLLKNLALRKTPKRWRTVNFEILGGQDSEIPFEEIFTFLPEDFTRLASFTELEGLRPKVMVHVGTNWAMKRWPVQHWVELLEKIHASGDFSFVFIGGKEDVEDVEFISRHLSFPISSLLYKTNLVDLVLLLRNANYFLGIDSGPSNLAHLVDLRSITIFGPGPHMYMPTDPRDVVLDKTNGRAVLQMFFLVKKGTINKITVDEVFAAFQRLTAHSHEGFYR